MKRTTIVTISCLGLGAIAVLALLSLLNSSSPVVAQQGVAPDVSLLQDVPVLAISPDSLQITQQVGDVTTRVLTLTNNGLVELTFSIVDTSMPGAVLLTHFDESAGATTFQDVSGNDNHGSCVGASCPTAGAIGKHGNALDFDGTDDYVQVYNEASLNPQQAIAMSAWIYPEDWNGNRRIFQKGMGDNQYRFLAEDGWLRFHLSGVGELDTTLPATGAWHHVVGVYDGAAMQIWVDGQKEAEQNASGTIDVTVDPLFIGSKYAGAPIGDHFHGLIDETAIYDRALTSEEIGALYGSGPSGIDVAWLYAEPISGTVGANSNQVISVTFDATAMQPGAYTTQLVVHSSDPLAPSVAIPISMTVLPSADMGRVAGSISDAWTGRPISATVELIGVHAQEAAPTYTIWAPAGTYALSAYAPGYVTTTISVQIGAGELVTRDLALRPTEMRVYLPVVPRSYCPDFFDTFSDPGSGWEVWDDDYVRSEYLNGEFRVLTRRSGYFYLFGAPACDRVDYEVEVDARWAGEPGSSYGLIFGLREDYRYYYFFDINTDYGMFRLYRRTPDGFTAIVLPTESSSIRRGTASNHLVVRRRGSGITLFVNGVQLGTWHDGVIGGPTGAGVMASPYDDAPTADARFDNFRVVEIRTGSTALPGGLEGTASCGYSGAYRAPLLAELEQWPH